MQMQPRHISQTHSSLSNITSNHIYRRNTRHISPSLLLSFSLSLCLHFLLTTSLIWCHADGCNCQMVFAGQLSHVESLSPVGGRGRRLRWVESAPLVLQGAATSLSDNCAARPVFIFMITLKQPSSAVRCLFFLPALKHRRHFTFSELQGLSLKMSKTQLFLFTANFDTFVFSGK